ncbi:hypothetical protein NHX12_022088 [Muraenolepis orangiensis]|uniref:Uncharacterized protein n=1 Tax=Muraenolepis orangiensis TaxID=630683 RepID=A0A9Q0EMI2_9TELE|nr:hypothetical protein NHX12_022088 [Muraenolepis orangiensis]
MSKFRGSGLLFLATCRREYDDIVRKNAPSRQEKERLSVPEAAEYSQQRANGSKTSHEEAPIPPNGKGIPVSRGAGASTSEVLVQPSSASRRKGRVVFLKTFVRVLERVSGEGPGPMAGTSLCGNGHAAFNEDPAKQEKKTRLKPSSDPAVDNELPDRQTKQFPLLY